jgi:hypothetical protein
MDVYGRKLTTVEANHEANEAHVHFAHDLELPRHHPSANVIYFTLQLTSLP